MKLYDKKGFVEALIGIMAICFLEMVISLANKGTLEIKPSTYIILSELWSIFECFSQARAEINIWSRQRKKEIMEEHFGDRAKVISVGSTAALFLCLVVMGVNLGIGIGMGIVTIVVYINITNPVSQQLRETERDAQRKKKALPW